MKQYIAGSFILFVFSVVGVTSAAEPAPPQLFTNSLGMKFVLIQPGEFLMGSPEKEEGHGDDELQHRVKLTKPYYLGQHEVTVGQYRRFAEATGYKTEIERGQRPGFGFLPAEGDREGAIEILPQFNWKNNNLGQSDEHAVINLGWADAVAFCRWLSETETQKYRLPTEAEWEYACRAGTTTRFSTGDDETSLAGYANLADAAFRSKYTGATWSMETSDGHAFTAPVGSLKPNAWDLHDMHGNAWEWCSDWYGADYYSKSPAADPTGPESGEKHVLRGGAFTNRNRVVRCADRDATSPKYRYNFTGFRVVREVK